MLLSKVTVYFYSHTSLQTMTHTCTHLTWSRCFHSSAHSLSVNLWSIISSWRVPCNPAKIDKKYLHQRFHLEKISFSHLYNIESQIFTMILHSLHKCMKQFAHWRFMYIKTIQFSVLSVFLVGKTNLFHNEKQLEE